MHSWYVVETEYRAELLAESHLRKRVQVFNPKCPRTKVVRGVEVTTKRPYLPGYVFVNFDREDEPWKFVNATPGVKRLLGSSPDNPSKVQQGAMDIIIGRCQGDLIIDPDEVDRALERFIPIGATVKVRVGPWTDFEGPVIRSDKDRSIVVLLHLFGRATEVTVKSRDAVLVN